MVEFIVLTYIVLVAVVVVTMIEAMLVEESRYVVYVVTYRREWQSLSDLPTVKLKNVVCYSNKRLKLVTLGDR